MSEHDWTQPPFSDAPGDLAPVLTGARLAAIDVDRILRTARLRFELPPDAGIPRATFAVEGATHLLTFGYLPPAAPLGEGLSPEETVGAVGDWARQGLIVAGDLFAYPTPLIVARAFLHPLPEAATLSVEGYGEDADVLVWWEVRVSGARIEAV